MTLDVKAQSIAAATGMGTVDLNVTDADRALRFYRDYVGLTQLPSDGPEFHMGAAGRELVVLHPGAERPVEPRTSDGRGGNDAESGVVLPVAASHPKEPFHEGRHEQLVGYAHHQPPRSCQHSVGFRQCPAHLRRR